MTVRILQGDCRNLLRTLLDESVHCCVTSPPYFGLRDYGVDGQMGLEESPEAFIAGMVEVFREVRRVLRADGTLWLNIGDSYASSGRGGNPTHESSTLGGSLHTQEAAKISRGRKPVSGFKEKDLMGIPWMLAFALRADGWYLRQDIIWAKPNPMPESVRDRCTKSHEYLFLLSKSPRYYFDAEAISEPLAAASIERLNQPGLEQQTGSDRVPGKTNGAMKAVRGSFKGSSFTQGKTAIHQQSRASEVDRVEPDHRNKRSVWTITTQPFKEAHFATFPPALVEPCILAGCPLDGVVLDPFGGAGTTGLVADREQRNAILIELNPEYAEIARRRINGDSPLFAETA